MIVYFGALILFVIGLYSVLIKRNLIKIIIGLIIMEYGLHLFLVTIGYRRGGIAPIITSVEGAVEPMVDPLPQALILTAIVIGLAVTALMVALAVRLYEKHGTLDAGEIKRLRG